MKTYKSILVLPDVHLPWGHTASLKRAAKWAEKHKPDLVVQLGDLTDSKGWSRWPSETDDPSPDHEWKMVQKSVAQLAKWFPKMEVLLGNHDVRHLKKAAEARIPSQMIRSFREMFDVPGWNFHTNPRKKLIVKTPSGPVMFVHGDEDGGKVIDKATMFGMNVVQGHDHKAEVVYRQVGKKFVFGASAGNMLDPASKGSDYNARSAKGSVQGFMVIKNGVPYFLCGNGDPV